MDETSIINAFQQGAQSIMGYFINFGGEFGVMEKVLLYAIAPAIGIMISIWGVIDFMKLKKRGQGQSTPASIIVRFIVGPITIQLALFVNAMSSSIFGEREFRSAENLAASYVSAAESQQSDPVAAGLLTLVAFLVLVGWVAALRAMVAFARIGSPNENGYELFRTGAARLIAATFLCMFQFVIDDLIESVGGGSGTFTSTLGL